MRTPLVGAAVGLLGTLPFLFGGASSSGGVLGRMLTFPVAILELWRASSGATPEEANWNLIALIAQFVSYFLLGCIVFVIGSIAASNATEEGRAKNRRVEIVKLN